MTHQERGMLDREEANIKRRRKEVRKQAQRCHLSSCFINAKALRENGKEFMEALADVAIYQILEDEFLH